jgi:uncharacterized LabA/DUF88 family protein
MRAVCPKEFGDGLIGIVLRYGKILKQSKKLLEWAFEQSRFRLKKPHICGIVWILLYLKNLSEMTRKNKQNNFAFIDSQNVYKGTQRDLSWKIDWMRFRTYLRHKYRVTQAYLFIGFMPEYNDMYDDLQKAGFILKFKPTIPDGGGNIKGNIDADLVLQAMIDFPNYDKAVLVSSDGDFYSLARYLHDNKKLCAVMSPYRKTCSSLLRKAAKDKMVYMDTLEGKLMKRKSTA